ncbi:MAG: hypothetical protein ACM3QU_12340 [Verrucomicrobiota bacterium]
MRHVWATIVTVWAIVAIVGFLAWTRSPATTPHAQVVPTRIVVTGRNGVSRVVVVRQVAQAHATTQTSPGAAGGSAAAAPAVASAGTVQAG